MPNLQYAYQQSISAGAQCAELHFRQAGRLLSLGRCEEAARSYRHALTLEPDHAGAQNGLGNALKSLGFMGDARGFLERAVALRPDNAWFHRDLAACKRFGGDDPQLGAMVALSRNDRIAPGERVALSFAIGKAYADQGRHDDAFRAWQTGHALQARANPYDESRTQWLFRRIEQVFTPDLMERHGRCGHASERPVFIVGMPRSGTTLVEQILASHKAVFGAGELPHLPNEAARLGGDQAFTEKIAGMTEHDFHAFGARILGRMAAGAPAAAARITDKMPSNFFFVGLIHLALPHARIVHVRRDPLDTCVSCYSNLFLAAAQNHDLAALGRYYRSYARLMEHWRGLLPDGVMIEVQYERLVADLETEARRVVAHCGLAWEDACLDFQNARRPVQTLSALAVRQQIHGDAVGRAQDFRAFLAPLIEALGL